MMQMSDIFMKDKKKTAKLLANLKLEALSIEELQIIENCGDKKFSARALKRVDKVILAIVANAMESRGSAFICVECSIIVKR